MGNYSLRDEDEQFLRDVIGEDCLERSIDWIKKNKEPNEIWDNSTLFDDIKQWIVDNKYPGDVFDEETLGNWAEENGFELK